LYTQYVRSATQFDAMKTSPNEPFARTIDVRVGSNSEVELADADFRFTLKTDIRRAGSHVSYERRADAFLSGSISS
jgi:hypothetical protein